MGMALPQFDVKTINNYGIVGAVSPGTAIPMSGTTLVAGTLTECISAANNTQESWGIEIQILETGSSAVACEGCVDIMIGGATDDVLITDLICGGGYASAVRTYFFPLHIPSGVRLAAQFTSVNTSAVLTAPRILMTLYGGSAPPFRVGNKVTTYGTPANAARGQAVNPADSGAAATATQMTASSTHNHFYFLPGFQCSTDTTMALRAINVGIGVGASTEERIGTWWYFTSAAEHISGSFPVMGAFRNVLAGTRLTLLASNSGVDDAAYDGLIYAVA